MKYLLSCRSFISLMILFSFFGNFGMEGETKEAYDHSFKIVFVGDAGVGKTQIVNKFVNNSFDNVYNITIGVDFATKEVEIDNKKIKLQLWDTAGNENFSSIAKAYYMSSSLIVLVYAINNRNSFENIQKWVNDVINNTNENPKFLLIGNKCDLEKDQRQVTTEEAQEYAEDNDMKFIEVSAKEGTNINDDMFNSIIQDLLDDMEKEKNNNPTYNNPKYIEHKIPDYHIQDINGIKNKKDSCWSEYCSCCPCLEKTEKNNKNQDNDEEQEEIENEEQEEKEDEEQEEI